MSRFDSDVVVNFLIFQSNLFLLFGYGFFRVLYMCDGFLCVCVSDTCMHIVL